MQKIIIYTALLFVSAIGMVTAQEKKSFEKEAKEIAITIKTVTQNEKEALKKELELIEKQLESGAISKDKAELLKKEAAEKHAKNIEIKVSEEEEKLRVLIKDATNNQIEFDTINKNKMSFSFPKSKDSSTKSEKRTTGQTIFALGFNNALLDGEINKDYKFAGSHFFEWGYTWNTRLSKENNLAHVKYGLSLQYNNFRPTRDRIFVEAPNGQTILAEPGFNIDDARFRNVNLVFPIHFELDFSKTKEIDGKKIFRSHEGFRMGIGGYAGFNIKSKQKIWYENENGNDVLNKEKGSFNVNDTVYGLSTYIGYKQTSLYVKYDLNPIFDNATVDQNNISFGVRFDWN
jgi:hypothetical protein